MREIKFRGKQGFEDKWLYGYLIKDKKKYYITNDYGDTFYEIIPKTIGQFTGLYDKNNTPIYEGDIVRFVRNFSKYKCSKKYDFEVYFNEFLCHYALHILDNNSNSYGKNGQFDILSLTGAKVKDLEVIGNIYDNEVEE